MEHIMKSILYELSTKNNRIRARLGLCTFLFLLTSLLGEPSHSQCTLEMKMEGTISFFQLGRLERGIDRAEEESCESLLILLNTPGGSLPSTRKIVESILNSPIPILCLVHPSGGHAGSAGAIILQACHMAGAMEATNIGAATPVNGSGKEMPADLRKKILNDTKSWVEGITRFRERSEQFGRDIIIEAKAVSAKEALKIGAIDFVAATKSDFLEFSRGQRVKLSGNTEIEINTGPLVALGGGAKDKIMMVLMDPEMAYMMFMASLGLLYFEITHPGLIAPGVIGGVGLVISLVSLNKMNVTWGGVILIFLGLIFMVMEAFIPSFGFLGVGGMTSFVVGSLFLFDFEKSGFELSLYTIIPTATLLSLIVFGIALLAYKSRNIQKQGGSDTLLRRTGTVTQVDNSLKTGFIEIHGETWKFRSKEAVSKGENLIVNGYEGLTLVVSKSNLDNA